MKLLHPHELAYMRQNLCTKIYRRRDLEFTVEVGYLEKKLRDHRPGPVTLTAIVFDSSFFKANYLLVKPNVEYREES